MTGVATKFRVADLVFAQLEAQGHPSAAILADDTNRAFAYLGTLGSSLADFMASRPDTPAGQPNTPVFDAWRPVLGMLAGTPDVGGTPGLRGLFRDLTTLRTTLTKLQAVIAAQDKIALVGMLDELQALPDVIVDLRAVIADVSTQRATVAMAIRNGRPKAKVAPSTDWWPRDTINGSRTGRFVSALNSLAEASGDDRLRAYALGSTVAYGAELCGNPYINSVVGGPHRNHWWRQRWIANYVDAWTFGYYESGGATTVQIDSDGVPNPLYANWPNLCHSALFKKIGIGDPSAQAILDAVRDSQPLPAFLPQELVDLWKNAYTQAYGGAASTGGLDDVGIQSAYAMSWFTLWFATSDELLPCMPLDQINYPDNCGPRPPWVAADGSTVVDGQVVSPPTPSPSLDPDVAEVVSGIAVALFGLANILFGNVAGGIALIVGGVALIADGVLEPDWEELRCFAGWTEVFVYNLTDAMHQLLKWTGLRFPYTLELAHDGIAAQFGLGVIPPDAALNTVRSRPSRGYPIGRWQALTSNWPSFPTEAPELPSENAYPLDGTTWPYHAIDGLEFVAGVAGGASTTQQLNPLVPGPSGASMAVDEGERQARLARLNDPLATDGFFGNAVEVSLELLTRVAPADLIDWDLDGDSGIGYPTWVLPTPGAARSTSIPE